jgi:BNR/Asp-box repeat
VLGPSADAPFDPPPAASPFLPRLVAASGVGSTVVAVVDTRPPLAVSHDAGQTWKASGRGLPAGVAVAVSPGDPDRVLFAARHRLYVSTDGGRFWHALEAELPDIEAVAWTS